MFSRINNLRPTLLNAFIQQWPLLFVFTFFIGLQLHKVFYLAPEPEYIWDNVFLWDWARSLVYGKYEDFVANSHHMLRWGNWGFAVFVINFFSDSITYYYLTTIIPSTLAGLVFTYIAYRYIGVWSAVIFCLLFYFDRELFRATFQLLPTGSALLPISLTLLLAAQIAEKKELSTTRLLLISLTCFWIYGVKETYLAFVPGVLFILYRYGGWRALGVFTGVFVVGYIIETICFGLISDDFSSLGRLWMLVHDGHHVGLMFGNETVVADQEKYFDSGLTLRWITPLGLSMILFFPAYLFSLIAQSEQPIVDGKKHYLPKHAISLMMLSFFFFTTFFIISLSPLRLGQPLMSRYIAVNIPFAYLMMLWFLKHQFSGKSWKIKAAAIFMLPFFFSHSLNRHLNYPDLSILNHSYHYYVIAKTLNDHDCIKSKTLSIVRNRLDLLPVKHRTEKVSSIINNPNHFIDKSGWFSVTAPDGQCNNPMYIRRTSMSRF